MYDHGTRAPSRNDERLPERESKSDIGEQKGSKSHRQRGNLEPRPTFIAREVALPRFDDRNRKFENNGEKCSESDESRGIIRRRFDFGLDRLHLFRLFGFDGLGFLGLFGLNFLVFRADQLLLCFQLGAKFENLITEIDGSRTFRFLRYGRMRPCRYRQNQQRYTQ